MDVEERVKQRETELNIALYIAREMIDELGKEKALDIIRRAWEKYGSTGLSKRLEGVPPENRLSALGDSFRKQAESWPDLKVIESTPERLSIEIHHCPTLDVCIKYGLPEVCQAYCDSDYVAAKAIHPKVRMVRDKEIAYGADYCNHTWILED